jgi:hypothetical protein
MSDFNHPCENRLKGKFKGLLDRFMGADCSHDEHPGNSRSEFLTPTCADILTGSRLMFTRGPEVTGEDTSLVCLKCPNKFIGSYPLASGITECNAGSSQLHNEGFNILCDSKCVSCDHSIDSLKY